MMSMNDIHFLRPNFLYLFIPFMICLLIFMRGNKQTNIWQKICDKELMPYILTKRPQSTNFIYIFTLATLTLLIIALAGPAWQKIAQPLIKSQSGLVIALDLSPSMNAEDIKPSRLQRALYKITDLLNRRQEGQTALLVFSKDAFVVTPLTDDTATIKALLPVLETKIMPSTGHNVSQVILKATELLTQAGIQNGSVLLLTSELTDSDMHKSIEMALSQGVKISILGIGKEQESAPIPKQAGGFIKNATGALAMTTLAKKNLSQLASSTGGLYVSISPDNSDADLLVQKMDSMILKEDNNHSELIHHKWHDQGYLLVLLALPFVSLIFRRGMLAITLLILPQFLQASYADLWKTADQQAEQLFHQEHFQEAKNLFQNEDWQAAVNYRLGDYETAAELFQNNQSADGLFNLGTAKAKLGDLEGALEAYNKALALQADHEDALYNKKIIEDYQKQQKNQADQSNQKSEQSQKNESSQDQKQAASSDQQKSSEQNQNETKEQDLKNDQATNPPQAQEKSPEEPSKDQHGNERKAEEAAKKQLEEMSDQYRDQIEKEIQDKNSQNEAQANEAFQQSAPQDEVALQEDSQRQIDDRWLERIQDDPGALLRRKFLQQYQQQHKVK